jgi:hypothetical protein
MSTDPNVFDEDDTPEYPLPSPTDPLSRDQRPPDDDVEAIPQDRDDAGADGSPERSGSTQP